MRVGDQSNAPTAFVLAAMSRSVPRSVPAPPLPVAASGAPDFDAIRAAGGSVQGALPNGSPSLTVSAGGRAITIFAAHVVPAGGVPASFTKGVAADGQRVERRDPSDPAVANALQYVEDLPSSLGEARLRGLGADPSNGGGAVDVWA